jgi:hypothetical protein
MLRKRKVVMLTNLPGASAILEEMSPASINAVFLPAIKEG